jgi:membrane associated rhomboid family serine protease
VTQSPSATNYCYRHPNRQSFVLCQRCGRTICGECQTPGAVGVICPECMKQQRATAPKTKSAFLTRMTGAHAPVVTYAIIGICILVYIVQSLPVIGGNTTDALQYAGLYSYPQLFEPWRMFTSIFAHASIIHIALNMYTLWIFGMVLEPMLGRIRYLVLFLLSGLAGSLGVFLIADPRIPVIGASGAIFGMMAAFLIIQRRLGGNATQLLILVGINLVIGFVIPGIAWQAHLGGLVGGALVGLIYVETRRLSRQRLQVFLLSALTVAILAVSSWRLLA